MIIRNETFCSKKNSYEKKENGSERLNIAFTRRKIVKTKDFLTSGVEW